MNNYIRGLLGFPERNAGRLTDDEREREEEEAWKILKRLGLNPREYFPDEK